MQQQYFAFVQDLGRGKNVAIRMSVETYNGVDAETVLREQAPGFCIANGVEWDDETITVSNIDGVIVAEPGDEEFIVCGPDYSKVMGYIVDQFDFNK